jgi:hypothetical protein
MVQIRLGSKYLVRPSKVSVSPTKFILLKSNFSNLPPHSEYLSILFLMDTHLDGVIPGETGLFLKKYILGGLKGNPGGSQ